MGHFTEASVTRFAIILRDLRSTKNNEMKKCIVIAAVICCFANNVLAQSSKDNTAISQITKTLTDYIEGSTNGQPNRLKMAFHPNLNLYYVKDGTLKVWSGKDYIEDTKEGEPTGETGKIISIDYENDIGVAKVQIANPKSNTPYIDYFMLMKLEGKWTIIHKMFTKMVN